MRHLRAGRAEVRTDRTRPRQIESIPPDAGRYSLFRFVDYFYRPDLGVIRAGREREQQFALAVGMQSVEFADQGPERSGRGLKNIEVLKQQDAITANIEDSTPWTLAARGRNQRAEER